MRKFFACVLAFVALNFMSCATVNVEAGYVGIKVYKLGGEKGVESEALKTGWHFQMWNEEIFTFPVFAKVYPFTLGNTEGSPVDEAFYFQTKDGVKCNVDLSVQCRADAEKVTILFQKYRQDMEEIIKKYLRNDIRNEIIKYASTMTVEDMYGEGKIKMFKTVEDNIKVIAAASGIIIDNISLLSDIRFPPEVETAIVAKIKAVQEALMRENEVQRARAEAEIKVVAAKAEADSIRLRQTAVTPILLEYEKVQVTREAVAKWNGGMPQYMMGNSLPFISVSLK